MGRLTTFATNCCTASAVFEAPRFKTDHAAMVVRSFPQEHRLFEDFAVSTRLLGIEAGRGKLLRHILPSGKPLDLGWAVGSADFL
jgi:hypothetical protein